MVPYEETEETIDIYRCVRTLGLDLSTTAIGGLLLIIWLLMRRLLMANLSYMI